MKATALEGKLTFGDPLLDSGVVGGVSELEAQGPSRTCSKSQEEEKSTSEWGTKRWSTAHSSKVKLPPAIDLRALCGAYVRRGGIREILYEKSFNSKNFWQ